MTATPDQRIGRMVAGMAEVFGVSLTDGRLRGYVEALREIPLELLQRGIRHAIVTWRYPDMPKPADIRAAVDREQADAQRLLTAPPDRESHHVCAKCSDSGWVMVQERTDRAQPTVRRCPCYTTNPKLVAPKTYATQERR